MATQVFVLVPNPEWLEPCTAALARLSLEWEEVGSLDELIERAEPPALAFLPLKRTGVGMQGLSRLRSQAPGIDVVALAARSTIEEAADAMRLGAIDYLARPPDAERIVRAVRRWQERYDALSETARLSEIITLMELGRTLTSTLRLTDLYEQIIVQVERAFLPNTVSLMLLDDSGRHLRLVAQRGLPATAVTGTEVSIEESIAGQVVREGRPQLLLGGLQGTDLEKLARGRGTIGSAMSVPLNVQRRMIGVLNVNRHPDRRNYTADDANLLHIFASQIAIALQNAQLYESLREERDRIIKAQEDVRRELARDLHDGLTQVLATLALNIDHLRTLVRDERIETSNLLEDLEFLRTMARQAMQDARMMMFGLRPLVLETQGLVSALDHYISSMREGDKRIQYHFDYANYPVDAPLAPNVGRMVFAVLQEAITNARKHSRARNILVELRRELEEGESLLCATVRDDGTGFNLNQIEGSYDQNLSFGLLNMRERAKLIDADLDISTSSEGTSIQISVPWYETARS